MSPDRRRKMTLLDATLLVASAAIGFGLFQYAHRGLFQGWIWILDRGVPGGTDWTALLIAVTATDLTVFLIPVIAPWTVLLILLRLRPPRPSWRKIWRQPGMAACLSAVLGWLWGVIGFALALDVAFIARTQRTVTPVEWAQKYLSDEMFMYIGLAVAVTWASMFFAGRWRRSADWIDMIGRFVGVAWIVIGVAWTLHEYLDLF